MEQLTKYIREIKDNQSSTAFYKVVQLCQARVFTICYRIIGQREEAEEAAQDVFLKCFDKIHSLDDESKFIPWLLRIAYNKAIDYVRKNKMDIPELDYEKIEYPSFKEYEQGREKKSSLSPYISICDEVEKAIITLYYQEDMSIKEIAETLELTKSNVKIKLFRARNKIKQFIEVKNKNISK